MSVVRTFDKEIHFSYRGFEQLSGIRQFTFVGLTHKCPDRVFHLRAALTLLTQHRASLQETPSLCVQLLTTAATAGEEALQTCEDRTLTGLEMLAFTAPRRAALIARGNSKPREWHKPAFNSMAAPSAADAQPR